ncbi:hypothetical protein LAZ40_22520 [Cereibacter sphaeroides]|uniref:hypothetical protein n=1 Tax=Rhodobacterales TaxID=204455 RepID=UPI000BBE11A4|nr:MULTISPECIES: hypothetical protein [Paracoccaceae]MCE6953087.1 hypothetical protein [Cereibacter sphaeroides]MCE6961814.1 hypothetical protein [Cereibacter sphaeroides]MCE6970589.1 hypothetical protein [Cereibacter sphaeroides]MCE6975815.1 hypothetical protein [Cereibacter sphaeroides]
MVDIISRRDGPRREDAAARHLIDQNRQSITRLADQLTGGGYSASRAAATPAPSAPEPPARRIHAWGGPAAPAEQAPYLRISRNGRVVIACASSGRQLHLLGELRRRDGRTRFALATAGNGFLSPVAEGMAEVLGDLDGCEIGPELTEERLARELSGRLGLTA